MTRTFLAVALGGAIGSAARYGVARILSAQPAGTFPMATFAANIAGCLVIGLVGGLAGRVTWIGPDTKLLLTVGLCGGFTTFSTFCNESLALMRGGNIMTAALYAAMSMGLGVVAVAAGMALARQLA